MIVMYTLKVRYYLPRYLIGHPTHNILSALWTTSIFPLGMELGESAVNKTTTGDVSEFATGR